MKFSGPLFCISPDLSSVTDFSGISQCANQQEEGQQNWTSNDQGQLHLRSLILCSLASAPLLITAHVFPVEWKGLLWVWKIIPVLIRKANVLYMGNLWC